MSSGSFAFRQTRNLPFMTLDSLGWTTDAAAGYGNHGMSRLDHGHVIFQYTLSGEGAIELEDQTYALPSGCGFLVKVPSEHRYYYPAGATVPWAFLWLNAAGEDALRMWDRIIRLHGPIVMLPADSEPIRQMWALYRAVAVERVTDAAALSTLLYRWMLSMLQPDKEYAGGAAPEHPAITRAKQYMRAHYAQPITLEDVARDAGVSRSYLCRLFQQSSKDSPLSYLQRRRIEAAVSMLRRTRDSVQVIGQRCGFDSPSYFGKVFRQYMNIAPHAFRQRAAEYPYDTVFLDS